MYPIRVACPCLRRTPWCGSGPARCLAVSFLHRITRLCPRYQAMDWLPTGASVRAGLALGLGPWFTSRCQTGVTKTMLLAAGQSPAVPRAESFAHGERLDVGNWPRGRGGRELDPNRS